MSAIELIKEKERRLTLQDWLRSHKQTLVLRCAAYGLSTTGNKPALAERLMAYLHPSEPQPGTSYEMESDHSDTDEMAANLNIPVTTPPVPHIPPVTITTAPLPTYTPGFDIENIRAMIRQEMGYASFPAAPPSHGNLSPASLLAPAVHQPQQYERSANSNPSAAVQPGFSSMPAEGNFNSYSKSGAALPPISEKALKAVKNRDYVDLNSLLPNFLYDTVANPSRRKVAKACFLCHQYVQASKK